MTHNQKVIINFLHSHKEATLDEAVKLIGGGIYANKSRYVSLAMSRMVKSGLITRISPGLFKLNGPQEKQGNLL